MYRMHLRNFKDSLRGRGLNLDGIKDNELWALGQHYGLYTPLYTPLLDWTFSFYIALFFAFFGEREPESGYRSVYCFLAAKRGGMFGKALKEYNKGKEDYQTFEVFETTSEDNPRAINQAGLFTKFPSDFNLKGWVQQNFCGWANPILVKFNIQETERNRVLRELNLMNINPKTMFPDLQGSALNCNFKLYLMGSKLDHIAQKRGTS